MNTPVDRERSLEEITVKSDTRDVLAHASSAAAKKGFNDMLVVDVDAHITETAFWPEIVDRIDSDVYKQMAKSFQDRAGSPPGLLNSVPGMAFQDVAGRIPHQQGQYEPVEATDVHKQVTLTRRAMDSMGIDYMVVFPTPMLLLGTHPQAEVEVELAWAFNRWLTEEVLPEEPRMRGLMYLPFNTPEVCAKFVEEFRRQARRDGLHRPPARASRRSTTTPTCRSTVRWRSATCRLPSTPGSTGTTARWPSSTGSCRCTRCPSCIAA